MYSGKSVLGASFGGPSKDPYSLDGREAGRRLQVRPDDEPHQIADLYRPPCGARDRNVASVLQETLGGLPKVFDHVPACRIGFFVVTVGLA